MQEMGTGWKLFRAVCIVQLILVAMQLVFALVDMISYSNWIFYLIAGVCYLLVFLFLSQGLTLLNYHYPDTPLSQKQKRIFNWLFLLNVLLISLLFARVLNEWQSVKGLSGYPLDFRQFFIIYYPLFFAMCIFIFHIAFLAGMFALRKEIHLNVMQKWYQPFEQEKE